MGVQLSFDIPHITPPHSKAQLRKRTRTAPCSTAGPPAAAASAARGGTSAAAGSTPRLGHGVRAGRWHPDPDKLETAQKSGNAENI